MSNQAEQFGPFATTDLQGPEIRLDLGHKCYCKKAESGFEPRLGRVVQEPLMGETLWTGLQFITGDRWRQKRQKAFTLSLTPKDNSA